MNSFLQEVITQGDYLKKTAAYYRSEGAEAMRQITDLFHEKKMNRVVLTGMGSSLYAMDTVLSYLTGHGIPALSYSSFELSRFQFGQLDGRTLVIAVSQSGNSAEVIELVEKAKAVTTVVGIFNNESSKLAQLADIRLPIGGDKELSITSKTYELTMLILNILARHLTGEVTEVFWEQVEQAAQWCCDWCARWEENSRPLYDFAQGVELFDLLANDTSLATARQLSLAYREGLHNCAAVWECADYAHGQYHSAKMAEKYLAQMFFPVLEPDTKEMKMLNFILDHGGKVIVYTTTDLPRRERLMTVKMPDLPKTLIPLAESVAAETFLAMLFGPTWVKDH